MNHLVHRILDDQSRFKTFFRCLVVIVGSVNRLKLLRKYEDKECLAFIDCKSSKAAIELYITELRARYRGDFTDVLACQWLSGLHLHGYA
jgi:hypothetical protein